MVAPLILIVEDEAPLSELLRYNLEKVGYRVQIAASGEDALHWVDVDVPDLAVVDWMLPDLSGIEFVRVLRSRTETNITFIIPIPETIRDIPVTSKPIPAIAIFI